MTIPLIDAKEAQRRVAEGRAVLVDIREPLEHAREAIPGARHTPLSGMDPVSLASAHSNAPAIIFHCQGGKRTADNAALLAQCSAPEVFLLEGGLNSWKAAGLPTRLDRSKPIEMQRQVQIAAGSLILLGLFLSFLVSPAFLAVSAFVGAGLVFAGASGWCGMAKLLGLMPWNRSAA